MQEAQETPVPSLGGEGPLEEGTATHSSILAWRILWTEEPGGLESMGSQSWTRLKRLSTRTHSVITRALRKREAGGDLTTEEERACDGRNRGSGDVVL